MNQKVILTILFCFCGLQSVQGAKKWKSSIPKVAANEATWKSLLQELENQGMHYGVISASARMLVYFSDVGSKTTAYEYVAKTLDKGYPNDVKPLMVAGDLDTQEMTEFTTSYNLYKGIITSKKGMKRWANYYFSKVNKESPKFLFYAALEAYGRNNLVVAEEFLRKILAMELKVEQKPLVKKVARTLARLLFQKEDYKGSLEIYTSFLSKVQPIDPNDWIEMAWNLYYLGQYKKTLGYLYNLQSKAGASKINLEKYVIRGLIYREFCNVEAMVKLLRTFESDFGESIKGIKSGKDLKQFRNLRLFGTNRNKYYHQTAKMKEQLELEQKRIPLLPESVRELATYTYESELKMLGMELGFFGEKSLYHSAEKLVVMGESLRFLKFDVAREKFSPEKVFQGLGDKKLIEDLDEKSFQVKWIQKGDFWRDERNLYRGQIKDKCEL